MSFSSRQAIRLWTSCSPNLSYRKALCFRPSCSPNLPYRQALCFRPSCLTRCSLPNLPSNHCGDQAVQHRPPNRFLPSQEHHRPIRDQRCRLHDCQRSPDRCRSLRRSLVKWWRRAPVMTAWGGVFIGERKSMEHGDDRSGGFGAHNGNLRVKEQFLYTS